MRIIKDIKELSNQKITSVSVGSFDGLHLGHQAIIKELVRLPHSLLISFNPHPRQILTSQNGNLRNTLVTQDEKIKLLSGKPVSGECHPSRTAPTGRERCYLPVEGLNVDNLLILKFDKKLVNTSAKDFIEQLIVKHTHPERIIIGYNHRFGKRGKGDFEMLVLLGSKLGFEVVRVPPVYVDGFPVSSSWLRTEIANGNVEKGAKLLGRLYSITSEVISGKKQGRTLGYPTANLKIPPDKLIPKEGVYAVWVLSENQKFKGMMNIGGSPTFARLKPRATKREFSLEVHIFDFNKDLHQKEITVEFIKYIRENRTFSPAKGGIEELKTQLQQDERIVRKLS